MGHAEEPDEARRELATRGLEVAAVSAGGFYAVDDTPARAFELAAAVGTDIVVGCAYRRLLPWLAGEVPMNAVLCLENHWYQEIASPPELAEAAHSSPRFAACLDTGHGLEAGSTPDRYLSVLGGRLGHVHLKDASLAPWPQRLLGRRLRRRLLQRAAPVFPGGGALDVVALRTSLERSGFAGTVSLEYEGADATAGLRSLLALWRDALRPPSTG